MPQGSLLSPPAVLVLLLLRIVPSELMLHNVHTHVQGRRSLNCDSLHVLDSTGDILCSSSDDNSADMIFCGFHVWAIDVKITCACYQFFFLSIVTIFCIGITKYCVNTIPLWCRALRWLLCKEYSHFVAACMSGQMYIQLNYITNFLHYQ